MNTSQSITLSPAQQQVVDSRGTHLQVIACAGSGKTESVSRRVASLIHDGVESREIVAFTFTERAAAELKDRISKRVTEMVGPDATGRLAQMYVGTIHGYCLKLLQDHVPKYGNYDVLDEHRHAATLFRFRREIGLSNLARRVWESVRVFAQTADVISNECISPAVVDSTPFGPMYRNYLDILDRLHVLTYGRIVQAAVETLEDSEMRQRIVGGIRHLVVDEYQDINPAQFRLIQSLASEGAHVCAVGDDDQAIYQWRGSSVSYIQHFARHFPGAIRVDLHHNRRSLSSIVQAAADFADTIDTRLDKRMEPTREHDLPAVVHFRTGNAEDEAAAVIETIQQLHAQGVPYRDMAMLFRSVRTSTGPFIEALADSRIPFVCGGRSGLFQQPEVRAVAKAHLWLGDMNWWNAETREEEALDAEIIAEEMKHAFRCELEVEEIAETLEHWKALATESTKPADLIQDYYRILEILGVHAWGLGEPDTVPRLGSLARFSTVLADFENTTRRGRYEIDDEGETVFRGGSDRGSAYYQRLAGYIAYYARDGYEEFEGEDDAGVDAVQILTIHGSKGLEWPVVFLPSLQDNRFPTRNMGRPPVWALPEETINQETRDRYAGGEDEERRLFYVAMTRARDLLYLSHFDRTARQASRRSRFFTDVCPLETPWWDGPEVPIRVTPSRGPESGPVAISLTELIRFDDCGHRYRLQRGLGFETQLVTELGFGKAIHHVLRRVAEEARDTGRIPDLARVEEIFDHELYFPFANRASEPQLKRKAKALVNRYVNNHRDDLTRIWATERPFELHLPQGFLSGRADVILDQEGGRQGSLAIVDYKSGTDGTSDDQFRMQLQIYAAAGRAEGLSVDAAYLHDLGQASGARTAVPTDKASCDAALDRMSSLFDRLIDRDFAPATEPVKCRRCEFQQICGHRKGC